MPLVKSLSRSLLLLPLVCLLGGCADREQARHEVVVPWALSGKWFAADLHTHTRFSDGKLSVSELVTLASANECSVLAITDHGDPRVPSVSPEFFEELDAARRKYPAMVVLAGLEWNVPPYGGHEHANLIVQPQIERSVLPQFKSRYDRGFGEASSTVPAALSWVASVTKDASERVLIYNHPLRSRAATPERVESDLAAWLAAGDVIVGFEGGPGHQRRPPSRRYDENLLQDRWDPTAAQIGGAWDRLLERGMSLWGAIANSDYHSDERDYEPCRFSQTFLQVPERSAKGVLQAIRAGSFWAGHGRVLESLVFTVSAPGLVVPASPGETIRFRPGGEVSVRVVAERNSVSPPGPLVSEIIGNCRSGRVELIASLTIEPGSSEAELSNLPVMPGSDGATCFLRARVRSAEGDIGNLMAYTNPIRVKMK